MMNEKKLSQMILKLHDRAEAAKYDGDSSPPYQEVEMLNFHDEESVVHTVLEDFYAVGALADELTHGFHMEERGYIDRTEVNSRLIAFARELERMQQRMAKWICTAFPDSSMKSAETPLKKRLQTTSTE